MWFLRREISSPSARRRELRPTPRVSPSRGRPPTVNQIAIQAIADPEQYRAENYPRALRSGLRTDLRRTTRSSPTAMAYRARPARGGCGNSFFLLDRGCRGPGQPRILLPTLQSEVRESSWSSGGSGPTGMSATPSAARSNFTARTSARELGRPSSPAPWARHGKDRRRLRGEPAPASTRRWPCPRPAGQPRHRQNRSGRATQRVQGRPAAPSRTGFHNGLDQVQGVPRRRADGDGVAVQQHRGRRCRGQCAGLDSIVNGVPYDLEDLDVAVPGADQLQAWTPVAGPGGL